jgi:hypothetical protein
MLTLKRAMSILTMLEMTPMLSEKFPWPMQDQAIFPVHVVGVERNLQCLTAKLVHVARFGEKNFGVLKLDVTVLVEYVICHCHFVGLLKLDTLALFHTCPDQTSTPPSLLYNGNMVVPQD